MSSRIAALGLTTMMAAGSLSASPSAPAPVSPGASDRSVDVSGRCPTFSWGAVDGAEGYELVVLSFDDHRRDAPPPPISDLGEALVHEEISGAASSWTPPAQRCLERGWSYAWSVRAVVGDELTAWGAPRRFRVAAAPTAEEVEDALATLREYVARDPEAHAIEAPARNRRLGRAPTGPRSLGRPRALSSDTTGIRSPQAGGFGPTGMNIGMSGGGPRTGLAIDVEITDQQLGYGLVVDVSRGYGMVINSPTGTGIEVGSDNQALFATTTGSNSSAITINAADRALTAFGQSCCTDTDVRDYMTRLQNDSGGDVLALEVGPTTTPSTGQNFIGFFGNSTLLASIEGDGNGNVICDDCTVSAPASDFAEYLPKRDPSAALEPGDVVGFAAGKVGHETAGAERAMVITSRPIVLANKPHESEDGDAPVAFLGQVPVKVRGPVAAGDWVVASGRADGTGVARTADDLLLAQIPLIVGRAVEDRSVESPAEGEPDDQDEIGTVRVLVGAPPVELVTLFLERKQERLAELEARLESLERREVH